MSIKQLIKMSNKYGADLDYVIAGGGNTSVKEEGVLYVKASGQSLSNLDENGLVAMHMDKLMAMLSEGYENEDDVLAAMMEARVEGNGRPSVEALLHALFEQKYVLHVHPAIINGITCSKQGKNAIQRLFGDKALWLDETRPGYTLAVTAKESMDHFKSETGKPCDLMFIQNHGVFFAEDDIENIDELVSFIMNTIENNVDSKPDLSEMDETSTDMEFVDGMLKQLSGCVCFRRTKSLDSFIANKEAFEPLSSAYTPDHIVYYGCSPLFMEKSSSVLEEIKGYSAKYGTEPRIICVADVGFFAVGTNEKAMNISCNMFLDALKIAVYTESFGGYRFMANDMIDFIRNWEVERYRANAGK